MSEQVNFLFDAIVTNYRLDNIRVNDPKDLTVSASINSKRIYITSSRINVSDFKYGSTIQFKTGFELLQKNIEACGMSIQVMVKGRMVGTGTLKFPSEVTARIFPNMSDIIYAGGTNLELMGNPVGSIHMLCRLTVKCEQNNE